MPLTKPPTADKWWPKDCVPTLNPEGFVEIYLRDDVFMSNVHLIVAPTLLQYQEWCKRVCDTHVDKLPTAYACATQFYSPKANFGRRYVIYLSFHWNNKTVTPDDVLCLCHEATHVSRTMLVNKGVRHAEESEEVFAYHQEFIFGQLWAALRKKVVQGEWKELLDSRAAKAKLKHGHKQNQEAHQRSPRKSTQHRLPGGKRRVPKKSRRAA